MESPDEGARAEGTTGGGLPAPVSLLPHRPPFLFVDVIEDLEPAVSVRGSWTTTGEEWFFAGHFPDRPTLPGVLMLESLAQLGACGLLSDERFVGRLPLFGGADKVKFRRQVTPGERLDLEVELGRLSARAGRATGRATVDGALAVQAEFMFVVVEA